jgi:hypothetical protein
LGLSSPSNGSPLGFWVSSFTLACLRSIE